MHVVDLIVVSINNCRLKNGEEEEEEKKPTELVKANEDDKVTFKMAVEKEDVKTEHNIKKLKFPAVKRKRADDEGSVCSFKTSSSSCKKKNALEQIIEVQVWLSICLFNEISI